MRFSTIFLLFFINFVSCKTNNMKSLTESMGQEVIEIGAPIKELPQELEEEPSAENDDDKLTTTTIQVATKKEFARITNDPTKKVKDIDKIDGRKRDDEEARIEKELADIYKDTIDYKADSAEVSKEENTTLAAISKPIERARDEFKFQPDSSEPDAIARFRTSIDEISCDKKLSGFTKPPPTANGAEIPTNFKFVPEIIFYAALLPNFYI